VRAYRLDCTVQVPVQVRLYTASASTVQVLQVLPVYCNTACQAEVLVVQAEWPLASLAGCPY
jgi:hypothetical protein